MVWLKSPVRLSETYLRIPVQYLLSALMYTVQVLYWFFPAFLLLQVHLTTQIHWIFEADTAEQS